MRIVVTFHMDELGVQGEVRTGEIPGWEASAYRRYLKSWGQIRSLRERILRERRRGPGTRP